MSSPRKKAKLADRYDYDQLHTRYGESNVNLLCREVSSFRDTYGYNVKVDWKALAKSTSTGISKPLEYQMIWRHLFYKTPLLEKVEDGAEPLDDASDMEKEYAPVNEDSSEDTEDVSSDLEYESAPVDEDLAQATKPDVSSGLEKECVPVYEDLAESTKPCQIYPSSASCSTPESSGASDDDQTNLNPVTGNRRHPSTKTHAVQKESSMAVNIPLSGTISTKFSDDQTNSNPGSGDKRGTPTKTQAEQTWVSMKSSGAKEEVSPQSLYQDQDQAPKQANDATDGNQSVNVNQSIKENTTGARSKSPVNGRGC